MAIPPLITEYRDISILTYHFWMIGVAQSLAGFVWYSVNKRKRVVYREEMICYYLVMYKKPTEE